MPFRQVYSQGSHCSKDGPLKLTHLNLYKKERIRRDLLTQVQGVNQSHV